MKGSKTKNHWPTGDLVNGAVSVCCIVLCWRYGGIEMLGERHGECQTEFTRRPKFRMLLPQMVRAPGLVNALWSDDASRCGNVSLSNLRCRGNSGWTATSTDSWRQWIWQWTKRSKSLEPGHSVGQGSLDDATENSLFRTGSQQHPGWLRGGNFIKISRVSTTVPTLVSICDLLSFAQGSLKNGGYIMLYS